LAKTGNLAGDGNMKKERPGWIAIYLVSKNL
jgi:hypothetical protein